MDGSSISEVSKAYHIPRSTLETYLRDKFELTSDFDIALSRIKRSYHAYKRLQQLQASFADFYEGVQDVVKDGFKFANASKYALKAKLGLLYELFRWATDQTNINIWQFDSADKLEKESELWTSLALEFDD